VVSKNNVFFCL